MCISGTTIRSGGITTTDRRPDSIALLGFRVRKLHFVLVHKLMQAVGLSYTSFTGCAILLFSVSQKLLQLSGEVAGQQLLYAASYLNTLSLCSYDNAMARKLCFPLQVIYNDIREVVVSPIYRRMCDLQITVKDVALAPLLHCSAVEGAAEVCKTISDIAESSMGVLQERITI
jgi:hypothetical protein